MIPAGMQKLIRMVCAVVNTYKTAIIFLIVYGERLSFRRNAAVSQCEEKLGKAIDKRSGCKILSWVEAQD